MAKSPQVIVRLPIAFKDELSRLSSEIRKRDGHDLSEADLMRRLAMLCYVGLPIDALRPINDVAESVWPRTAVGFWNACLLATYTVPLTRKRILGDTGDPLENARVLQRAINRAKDDDDELARYRDGDDGPLVAALEARYA